MTLRETCPAMVFFLVCIFPYSIPIWKKRPEKTRYLNIFHAVWMDKWINDFELFWKWLHYERSRTYRSHGSIIRMVYLHRPIFHSTLYNLVLNVIVKLGVESIFSNFSFVNDFILLKYDFFHIFKKFLLPFNEIFG